MTKLGSDLDQMAALELLFTAQVDMLEAAASRVDLAVRELDWRGADSSAFRSHWQRQGRAAVLASAGVLRRSSEEVRRNRLEQVAASSTDGAGTVAPGSIGRGPTSAHPPGPAPDPSAPPPAGPAAEPAVAQPRLAGQIPTSGDVQPDLEVGVKQTVYDDGTVVQTRTVEVTNPDGTTHKITTVEAVDAQGNRVDVAVDERGVVEGKTEVTVAFLEGDVSAHQGLYADASASGEHYDAAVTALLGAEEHASGSVEFGKDGLVAKGAAGVFVGGVVTADGSVHAGPLSASGSIAAKAGAGADVDTSIGIGPDGVHASAGASAEIAASVDASAAVDVAGVEGKATGGVGVGVGASVDGHADVGLDKVSLGFDVSGYLGVGAKGGLSVTIYPDEIAGTALGAAEWVGTGLWNGLFG